MKRWFSVNRFAAFQFLGGLRLGRTSINVCNSNMMAPTLTDGVISNPVDMHGFGIRLGGAGHWQLPRGFSLLARGAGTLAYGKFNARLLETNLAGADTIVDVAEDQYQQAIPALEAALGVASRMSGLEISGGYELTTWFDVAGIVRCSSTASTKVPTHPAP